MLSTYVAYFLDWTAGIRELFVAGVILALVVVARAAWQRRHTRGPRKKEPTFHDQVMNEMLRFNEAVERMKRSADQAMAPIDLTAEESRSIPESAIGIEQPQG